MTEGTIAVRYSVDDGLAVVRMGRDHGNAINDDLLQGLMAAYQEAARDPAVRGVLLTSSGKLFSPGLDLQELLELDRREMQRFMGRFSACLIVMFTFPKPVVACIRGHALAGGCVLAITAEHRVLVEGGLIGLNEVKVGVPLPYGVSLLLRQAARTPRVEEVALLGSNYSGAEAVEVGLAHEIRPADGFEEYCTGYLRELASRDPRAYATTKRYLRSGTVERIRAGDALFQQEFLDCWFSDETRERIGGIVAGLQSKGGKK